MLRTPRAARPLAVDEGLGSVDAACCGRRIYHRLSSERPDRLPALAAQTAGPFPAADRFAQTQRTAPANSKLIE
jgi:hypothetical protein